MAGHRARAATGRTSHRVGHLSIPTKEQALPFIRAFEEGLRSLGYRVGENVVIEYRFANGEMDRLSANAATWSGSVWTSSSPPGPIRMRLRP